MAINISHIILTKTQNIKYLFPGVFSFRCTVPDATETKESGNDCAGTIIIIFYNLNILKTIIIF